MNIDNTPRQDGACDEPPLVYERPLIADRGSLTELTLGGGSDFSDGSGIGGSGS